MERNRKPSTALTSVGLSEQPRSVNIPLWASAFVIVALILMQASRSGIGSRANAEMVANGSEYSLVTTLGGNGNEEILYVLEKRSGRIFVYNTVQNVGMKLVDYQNIGEWVNRMMGKSQN